MAQVARQFTGSSQVGPMSSHDVGVFADGDEVDYGGATSDEITDDDNPVSQRAA